VSSPTALHRTKLAAAVLVVAAAFAAYLPGLPGDFVYDDHRLIVQNDGLKRPFDPARALLRDYYASDFDRMGLGYYRPVAVLSVELDYRRGGGASLPFHLTNAALHASASLLVFLLGLTLFEGGVGASAAAALLFAVHPAHAESVAFISGRVDPLMAVFALAAVLLHLGAGRARHPWWWRSGAGLAWLVALLSKEMAVTVPVLVVLLETAREGWPRPEQRAERAARYAPYAVAAALYVAMRWIGLGRLLGASTGSLAPSLLRPFVVLGSYLTWLVAPPPRLHLEPPPVTGIVAVGAALAVPLAVVAGIVLWRRGRKVEAALVGWCLVSLLPVAQLRPIETTLSERFLYLPSAGTALLIAPLMVDGRLWGPRRPEVSRRCNTAESTFLEKSTISRPPWAWRAVPAAVLVVLGAYYAGVLLYRVPLWRNELALWSVKAAEEPSSLKAQLNLAYVHVRQGRRDEALAAFERARKLGMDPAVLDGEIAGLLGSSTPEERIATLRRTIEHSPGDGSLRSNLGFFLLQHGDLAASAEAFAKAVELTPARAEAWLGLAMTRLRLRDLAGAEEAARRAAALNPELGMARALLAECELRLGRPCEALRLAKDVVLEDPAERQGLERILGAAEAACSGAN
jgi:protein O-mannosyl-transferase